MGLFGGSDDNEKEEVTLGIPENDESSGSDESSAEVRDLDFGSENGSEEASDGSRLEKQVESQVASPDADTGSTGKDISLEDVHEQNEEIKGKLDTLLSRL